MELKKSALMLLVLLLGCQLVFSQNGARQTIDAVKYFDENKRWYNEFTEHWFYFFDIPEEDVRQAIIHWEQIGEDLKNSVNPLEGTYGDGGETHGDYLRWSEKSGFIWLKVNKCQGGPMQIIRGNVSADAIQLLLTPEYTLGGKTNSHGNHNKNPQPELLFVKWNGVPFLVSKETIEAFADYAAGLGEFNGYHSLFLGNPFLSKHGTGAAEKVSELPIFPKGFEKFVKKPVKTQITAIGKSFRRPDANNDDWENLIIPVELNVGKTDGAKNDLKLFYVDEEQHIIEEIIITKVRDKSSTAEIVRSVRKKNCSVTEYNDCENPEYTKLKVGLKLSTTGN